MSELSELTDKLERLRRYLDELKDAALLQLVEGDEWALALMDAPRQMREARKALSEAGLLEERKKDELEAMEDAMVLQGYSDGVIAGRNAEIRARQERELLRSSDAYRVLLSELLELRARREEAEQALRQWEEEFHARLVLTRLACAKLEWLGWL